jgi:hypothetical protein
MARFLWDCGVRPVPGQNGGNRKTGQQKTVQQKVRMMVLEPAGRAADRAGVPARRCADDSQLWLAMLVSAMQDASRPECRALPCARSTLVQLREQLARPAPPDPLDHPLDHPLGATAFSRCN